MMICDNKDCKFWMHEECLIDAILTRTYLKIVGNGDQAAANNVSIPVARESKRGRKIWKGTFGAKIDTDSASGNHSIMAITDLRHGPEGLNSWVERLACLKCESLLE
jgi:hypothetical protein